MPSTLQKPANLEAVTADLLTIVLGMTHTDMLRSVVSAELWGWQFGKVGSCVPPQRLKSNELQISHDKKDL